MGGVDQGPATVDRDTVEQPFDRPQPGPGEAFGDFPFLLRNVDVNRTFGAYGVVGRQRVRHIRRQDGAQAVQGCARCLGRGRCSELGNDSGPLIDLQPEALLGRSKRRAAEAAFPKQHRQQRQADARCVRPRRDAPGQLGNIAVSAAAWRIVEIVELRDAGVAGLQHLDIKLRGNRLDLRRRQAADEAVHGLPP